MHHHIYKSYQNLLLEFEPKVKFLSLIKAFLEIIQSSELKVMGKVETEKESN